MKCTKLKNINLYYIDNPEWECKVKSIPNYDIYYLPCYVRAFQIHGDGKPILAFFDNDELQGIYVFMLREITDYEYDIVSPYGYGGWLLNGNKSEENIVLLKTNWEELALRNDIIDSFTRFHPVIGNANDNRQICEVVDLGLTIALDLESPEIIWNNITSKNRNMIRKAQKNGIEIKHGKGMELLDKFKVIYNSTMEHDNADPYYFFEREFYESIDRDCNDNYEIFYAEYNGEIISIAIMLFANNQMHYHLSGSVFEYRNLAPSNLLLYEAALWGCSQGFKSFHLGGGVGSGRDALFKFKEGFNRNSGLQFSIGKHIFNKQKYDFLVRKRASIDPNFDPESKFFPLYRS